jgi:hypothetical protein
LALLGGKEEKGRKEGKKDVSEKGKVGAWPARGAYHARIMINV